MPANRGLGSPNWSPQPDFTAHQHIEPTLDERIFNINSEKDVAEGLLETDPTFESYQWCLSNDEIEQLALESAREIITMRNFRKEFLEKRAERRKREGSYMPQSAVVVGSLVLSTKSGSVQTEVHEVERTKSFN